MEEAIKQIKARIAAETNHDARIAFRTALLIFTEAQLKYNEDMLALEKKNCSLLKCMVEIKENLYTYKVETIEKVLNQEINNHIKQN